MRPYYCSNSGQHQFSTTMGSSSNGTSGYEPIDPNAPPSSLGGKLTIALIVGFILMILCIMFISVYASVFPSYKFESRLSASILSVRRAVHDAAETSPKRQRTWLKQLNKTAASTAFSKWARSHGQNHPGLDLDQPIWSVIYSNLLRYSH